MTERGSGPFGALGPAILGLAALLAGLSAGGHAFGGAPGPSFLLVVLALYAQRRPATTPPLLVFALGLAHDLARDGPVGAELIALLITIEALRGAADRRPALGLAQEIARFAGAVVFYNALVWALLAASYAPTPPIDALGLRALLTALLYPAAAAALAVLLGLRAGEGRFAHLGLERRRGRLR
ncbi:MAG: hypothetical protein AAFR16_05925 [Pseudomonadota bacterium]